MGEAVLDSRNRWIVAAGGGAVIITGLIVLFRFPASTTPLTKPATFNLPAATVQLARSDDSDRVLRAEALLRDLRPLFLPTERNAALPEPVLEPGRTFLDNEALKMTFSEVEAQISKDLPPIATLSGQPLEKAKPADVLSPSEAPFSVAGIGRKPAEGTALAPRAGFLQVIRMKDGTFVLSEPLPLTARPPSDKPWAPLEMIAAVDAAGLVSPPFVKEGSRVEEVDAHFRNYLVQDFRIGSRLPPGFYRITVAP